MNATQLTQSYRETLQNTINYYNRIISSIHRTRLNFRVKQYYIGIYKNRFNDYHKALNNKFHNSLVSLVNPDEIKITKNKKGLLIGINYNGTDAQLNGCINDTTSIYTALTTSYGFKSDDISIITDDTEKKPTRDEILSAFKAFLESGAEGDLLFFSYSGHGSSTYDRNSEEDDGKDEMIVTSDLQTILDDELKSLIQLHLKKGVTLFALFDCCFSGTVLDLKYQYLDSLENDTFTTDNNDTETKSNVIMISGCNDTQTSADAFINQKYQGAMTWAFLNTLKDNASSSSSANLSWKKLLIDMRDKLKQSEFTQLPQLSSGCLIDINDNVCF
jgi:hypothetical protein